MMLFQKVWKSLRPLLVGPALVRAVERNEQAADALDVAVREMLKK